MTRQGITVFRGTLTIRALVMGVGVQNTYRAKLQIVGHRRRTEQLRVIACIKISKILAYYKAVSLDDA